MTIENKNLGKKNQKKDEATQRAQEIVDSFFNKAGVGKESQKDPAAIVAEAAGRTMGKLAVGIGKATHNVSSVSDSTGEGVLEEKLAQAYSAIPDKTETIAVVKSASEEKNSDKKEPNKTDSDNKTAEEKAESKEQEDILAKDEKAVSEDSAKASNEDAETNKEGKKDEPSEKDTSKAENENSNKEDSDKQPNDKEKKDAKAAEKAASGKNEQTSIHEQRTTILETRKSAFRSTRRSSLKEHPASGNSMVFSAADVVSKLVQMPINKRNEKKEAESIIKDARRAVLEEADYTSSYRAYSKMLTKGGARKSSVLSTLHKVPGCYVVATYPPKLKWDRDLASYTDLFVGSAECVGEGILECCSRHGCADVYADVKYRQNVQIFIFSCDISELDPLREELIASLGAMDSYNKYI